MTFSVGPTYRVGDCKIAVLSQVTVRAKYHQFSASVIAAKQPLFLLIARSGRRDAIDMTGQQVLTEDIDALCHTAWDQLHEA